jgi:hypothetical protein
MTQQVNAISAAKRKALPTDRFALPSKRKYPVDTAARTRNAAARLEQAKKAGKVSDADYAAAKSKIAAAAKKFGIASEYAKPKKVKADLGTGDVHAPGGIKVTPPARIRRGLHIHLGPNGQIAEIRHASDKPQHALMFDALPIGDVFTKGAARLSEIEAALATADEAAAIALRSEQASIVAADGKPVWIQIAKVGRFAGHPSGAFELTPSIFDEICRNFTAVDRGQVPVDFEHACEADASEGAIPVSGAPAQGWIRALDNRGLQGLWALVDWLEPARGYIKEGKYQAVSPAIRFGARHPETGQPIGARLTSVALTNRPFLRGMQQVAARDQQETPMLDATMTSHAEFMPRLRAALRLGEMATYKECGDQLNRLRGMCSMADDPTGMHEGVNLGDYLSPMKALMNMPANATLEEMFDAVEEMIDAAIERHEALYHSTDAQTETAAPMADNATEGDTAMADAKTLKDTETERDGALAKLRDEEAKTAGLSLQLKDAQAKVAEATALCAAKDAEIKLLTDAAQKRADDDASARVEDAFATYKDAKKLTDADKKAMRITLRSDAALFDELYPRVAPNHQHILRDLTGAQGVAGNGQRVTMRQAAAVGAAPAAGYGERVKTLTDKYRKDGLSLEDAIARASKEAKSAA